MGNCFHYYHLFAGLNIIPIDACVSNTAVGVGEVYAWGGAEQCQGN